MAYAHCTKLYTRSIKSLSNAALRLGEVQEKMEGGVMERWVPMVLAPDRSSLSLTLQIPEGMHAVVQSNGRYLGIWKPGFYWAAPWINVSHLVSKQYIVYDTPVKECPTLDNVFVEIDVSVVLHVMDDEDSVKNFVYKLGPERLEQMLKAFQEEAVRTMARKKTYTRIYDLMDTEEFDDLKKEAKESKQDVNPATLTASDLIGNASAPLDGVDLDPTQASLALPTGDDDDFDHHEQLENTKRAMNERLNPYGIEVYSITITNVKLPANFAREMESATTYMSKNAYAAIEQTYNLQVLHNGEKQSQHAQKLTEDRQETEARALKDQAEQKKLLDSVLATTELHIAEVEEKHRAEILGIKAESSVAVAKAEKAADVLKAEVQAQADAEARVISAEKEAYVQVARSKAELEIARYKAETLKLRSEAEGKVATQLKERRDFEAKMEQLRVIRELAENGKVVFTGKNTDNTVAQMVAARDAGAVVGLSIAQ